MGQKYSCFGGFHLPKFSRKKRRRNPTPDASERMVYINNVIPINPVVIKQLPNDAENETRSRSNLHLNSVDENKPTHSSNSFTFQRTESQVRKSTLVISQTNDPSCTMNLTSPSNRCTRSSTSIVSGIPSLGYRLVENSSKQGEDKMYHHSLPYIPSIPAFPFLDRNVNGNKALESLHTDSSSSEPPRRRPPFIDSNVNSYKNLESLDPDSSSSEPPMCPPLFIDSNVNSYKNDTDFSSSEPPRCPPFIDSDVNSYKNLEPVDTDSSSIEPPRRPLPFIDSDVNGKESMLMESLGLDSSSNEPPRNSLMIFSDGNVGSRNVTEDNLKSSELLPRLKSLKEKKRKLIN